MAYQPKSYRKLLASSVTAAVVASAFAGTAGAASSADQWKADKEAAFSYYVKADVLSPLANVDGAVTRAEAAQFFAKALNLSVGETTTEFSDLPASNWANEYVAALVNAGIINGYEDGTFRPDQVLTRAEASKIIAAAYNLEPDASAAAQFSDVKAWAAPYVGALANAGLTLGVSATQYGSNQELTLAQTAVFAHRAVIGGVGNVEPLEITSTVALDATNRFIQVNFNKAVTGLEAADVMVQNVDSLARYGVKDVRMSSNGKTATIELFSNDNPDRVLEFNQDYRVTVEVNGQTVEGTFNRPAYVEQRVTKVDMQDRKITLAGAGTLDVPKSVDLDFEEAKGRTIHVWYNDNDEVVKYEYDKDETVIYAPIQLDKADRIKTLNDGTKIDTSDRSFDFYLNDKEVDYVQYRADNITSDNQDPELDYAKVVLGSNGEVEYIAGYNFENYVVVNSVDESSEEIVGVTGTDSISSAADYLVIKDGKQISWKDVQPGDVVLFQSNAYAGDGLAVVYNNTVTGNIDNVYAKSVDVNGVTYDYVRDTYYIGNMSNAKFLNDSGDFDTLTDDDAKDLQAGGEVTLHLDAKGDLLFVTGDIVATAGNVAVLTDKVLTDSSFNKDSVQLQALFADGMEQIYNVQLDTLDKITVNGVEYDIDNETDKTLRDNDKYYPTITTNSSNVEVITLTPGTKTGTTNGAIDVPLNAKGDLVEFGFDANDNVKELKVFKSSIDTSAGEDEALSTLSTSDKLELGDAYAKTTDGAKLLKDNTVVYDVTDGYDASDIIISTWGDYKGSDITNAQVLYDDNNEVTAVVIKGTDSDSKTYEEAVITDVQRNTDSEVTALKAYVNGKVESYTVDKLSDSDARGLRKGDVAVLVFDDTNLNFVKKIDTSSSVEFTPRVKTGLTVTDVNVGDREVTFSDGTTKKTYKLVTNGAVLDGTSNSDVSVEALSDLRGKTNVTVVLDENASGTTFAKYFMWEPAGSSATPTPTADTTAPTATVNALQNASTNDVDSLVATFSEDLFVNTGTSAVAAGTGDELKAYFTANNVDSSANAPAISSATYDATNKTITFTIANATATDTITVTSNTVEDAAGNDFAQTLEFDGSKWSVK